MDITVIQSKRKTMSLEINKNCEVIVRAPYGVSEGEIREFVYSRQDWIRVHLAKMRQRVQEQQERERRYGKQPKLTEQELRELSQKAKTVLSQKALFYAGQMGVTYNRITIRCQKTRWGSCSSKQNLNFNCLLMLCPEKVQDYVVIHELCHLIEMNHSKRFWKQVENIMPDYRVYKNWLKEHGTELINRLP